MPCFDHKLFALEMADVIKEFVASEVAPIKARLAELETKGFRYRGVFEYGNDYYEGNAVTMDGQLWICKHTTRARPGDGGDWQLAVRRGRDARDQDRNKKVLA
jgi:hypothetical protein